MINSYGYNLNLWTLKPIDDTKNSPVVYVKPETKTFIYDLSVINVLKFVLEESEKVVLFNFLSNSLLGDFSFVSNSMGLIINNVLAPVELFFSNYFSKQYATIHQEANPEARETLYAQTFEVFNTVLKYMLIFCQMCVLYGLYILTPGAMFPFLGRNYGRIEILQYFGFYLVLVIPMAVNGITEALLYSIVPNSRYNKLRVYNFALGT